MKKLNQWIDRFAYSHPRFGIPNLMLYIVIANAVTYILTLFAGSAALSFLKFDLYHVLHGEVWRLVTFVLLPFTYRPISLFIMLSFCYFVGGTLEREWGTAKFTLYYLSGMLFSVLSTVILSLATGYYGWSLSDAYYINLTMFLAFAVMYPDAQVWFYGVIPLKAKWLAWADIALMAWNIARSVRYGAYASALAAVVAILNFVIFFWEDIKSILGSRAVSGPDRLFNSSPPSASRRRRSRSGATATSARSAAARTPTTRNWNSATAPSVRATTASARIIFSTTSTSQNKAHPAWIIRAGCFSRLPLQGGGV